jgi:hypothetical protein
MELMLSSILALVVCIALAAKGPLRGLWIFFAVTPLGAAAAFNLPAVGGASILVTDIAALTMFALVVVHRNGPAMIAGTMRFGQPGFWLLLLLLYGTFATLMFPSVFAGQTEVFSISRAANENGVVIVQLRPTAGNLTQLFRLILGVAIFFALAVVMKVRSEEQPVLKAMVVATCVNAAIGWIEVASYAVGLPDLMAPLQSANYAILADVRMAGLKRMIGGFPEASSFGYFSLGLFAFWFSYWIDTPRSRLVTAMMLICFVAVLRSTSSGSYVALLAYLGTTMLIWVSMQLRRETDRRGLSILVGVLLLCWCLAIIIFASYEYVTPVRDFLDRALFNKLDGASGVERGSWNKQAIKNFIDTSGLGAGLGSVRASSWVIATLSSLGVIGAALFFMFVGSVILPTLRRSANDPRMVLARAMASACMALVISATLTSPTPDLSIFFYAFAGIASGLTRAVILESMEQSDRKRS